jgi:hypothetical protein
MRSSLFPVPCFFPRPSGTLIAVSFFRDRKMMICATCGKSLVSPVGLEPAAFAAEESARCARMREIDTQRKAIDAARKQAGFAGFSQSTTTDNDTVDVVMQRHSMARLDAALRIEAEELAGKMRHDPAGS